MALNGTEWKVPQVPLLFVTKQVSHGMGANGIAGFGVSDITFLDRAYEMGLIESKNFIIRLLPQNR